MKFYQHLLLSTIASIMTRSLSFFLPQTGRLIHANDKRASRNSFDFLAVSLIEHSWSSFTGGPLSRSLLQLHVSFSLRMSFKPRFYLLEIWKRGVWRVPIELLAIDIRVFMFFFEMNVHIRTLREPFQSGQTRIWINYNQNKDGKNRLEEAMTFDFQ